MGLDKSAGVEVLTIRCSFGNSGGSDGTRTRGLLRGRRSNQLNYAPAY